MLAWHKLQSILKRKTQFGKCPYRLVPGWACDAFPWLMTDVRGQGHSVQSLVGGPGCSKEISWGRHVGSNIPWPLLEFLYPDFCPAWVSAPTPLSDWLFPRSISRNKIFATQFILVISVLSEQWKP